MPPANTSFRGASLYSGIFDSHEPSNAQESTQDTQAASTSKVTSEAASSADSTVDRKESRTSSSHADSSVSKANQSGPTNAVAANKSSGWSAALRFAPRRNVATNKNKARPNAAFVASLAPTDPAANLDESSDPTPSASASGTSKSAANGSSTEGSSGGWAKVSGSANTAQAAPSPPKAVPDLSNVTLSALTTSTHQDADTEELLHQLSKHAVLEPPAYTFSPEVIESDRAIFRAKAEARGELQRLRGNEDDYYDDYSEERWDGGLDAAEPDEDVNGFLGTAAGKRTARKKKKRKRGNTPPHQGPNMNADYDPRVPNDYLAFKQMVYERRQAELDFQRWQRQQGEGEFDEEDEAWEDEERHESSRSDLGDRYRKFAPPDTYKPSAFTKSKERADHDEDDQVPYRRTSPSPPAAQSPAKQTIPSSSTTQAREPVSAGRQTLIAAASGEEAYQRRLALSQASSASAGAPPPGPPPTRPGPPPPRPPSIQPSSASDSSLQPTASDFAARQSAAAAIAARLAAVAPRVTPVDPPEDRSLDRRQQEQQETDPHRFAERLMQKQGWVKGQGIGAEGNKGIINPLETSNTQKGKGHITNKNHDPKALADAELYGNASSSPVIVLLNMMTYQDLIGTGQNDDGDQDRQSQEDEKEELIKDIATECEKFGIVKRVYPHLYQEEEVRVFVHFTGPAASWKAVRALNGRWFEGKQVRAMYYDEQSFLSRELDHPL